MALSTPSYLHTKMSTVDAIDLRRTALDGAEQPGVMAAGDLLVAQTGTASMNLTVAAGAAWVPGVVITRQGNYYVYNDATISVNIPTNSSGNPRIDQVVLRVYDSSDAGQGQDIAAVEVVQGTPTAGATLANRTGAANLTTAAPSSLLLADVLVANGAASIANGAIRDRRPFARGAYHRIVRTTNAAAGSDYATTNVWTAAGQVDTTNIQPRIECSGVPVRVHLDGRASHSVGSTAVRFGPTLDGVLPWTNTDTPWSFQTGPTVIQAGFSAFWDFTPTPGSHVFGLLFGGAAAGTTTLFARADIPLMFTVEELVRPSRANMGVADGYG